MASQISPSDKSLPKLLVPSIHLYVTNNKKATMHHPKTAKVGDVLKKNQHTLVITKIKSVDQSTYYSNSNFYDFEYKLITQSNN